MKDKGSKDSAQGRAQGSVKQALTVAFDGVGGIEGLKKWAKENPGAFYAIWARMLPTETTITDNRDIAAMTNEELSEARRKLRIV